MKEFVNTDKYGKLYFDRILFETNYPILFTCKNNVNQIFICVCCQNNAKGCKWLVGKTDAGSVIRMLKDEITIRELICNHSSGKLSVDYFNMEYRTEYNNSDWDSNSIYLPKEDSYMFAEEGEFDDDIAYYTTLINQVSYDKNYYKNIIREVKTVNPDFKFVTEKINELVSQVENKTISSKLVNTLYVDGKLSVNKVKHISQSNYREILNNYYDTFLRSNIDVKIDLNDSSFTDAA
ncbi:MAG: hypothetical protein Q4C63_08400 [Eubacteriales bacterium]|nr:hypothetical protein [Eubacteriales bacterium]